LGWRDRRSGSGSVAGNKVRWEGVDYFRLIKMEVELSAKRIKTNNNEGEKAQYVREKENSLPPKGWRKRKRIPLKILRKVLQESNTITPTINHAR